MKTERDGPTADRGRAPASLGDVAIRISSRTTDLLAISIVLVASLTLGRQILHWWHAEPPSLTAAVDSDLPAPAWDDELQPLSLEFGDLPLALTRQVVMGDQQAAVEALVRHCQAAAESAERPSRELTAPADGDETSHTNPKRERGSDLTSSLALRIGVAGDPDNDAERRLLDKIAGLTPVVEKPGDWQVYVIDERFTLVAAVRRFDHPKSTPNDGSKETARGVERLVCWGMAMPVREKAWTLYVFRESPTGSASPSGLPNVPLPPGAHRNLSVRDERGGLLLGFSGSGSAQNWMRFYDDWFTGQGWSKIDKWSIGAEAWSARFSNPQAPGAGHVEIRFAADQNGELTGLLQIQ